MRTQAQLYYMHIICAICLWVCFMDLKHLSIDYISVCDNRNLELSYMHCIWYWRIGVLSINTIKTKHLYVQCIHMCVLKTSANKLFSACFLSPLSLSLLLGHLRQHKHEYKWLSSQRQEKRVEMKKKKYSQNETDPDIYVHFRRSLWPHRSILAPASNFQLW